MEERKYFAESSLADEFVARDEGIGTVIEKFVESSPWIVASVVLHLVLAACLALVSIGGQEDIVGVDLLSEFEQTETPEPEIEETPEVPEEVKPEEYKEDFKEDPNLDEIEPLEEEELIGDPEAEVDQPVHRPLGAIGTGAGHPDGAYGGRPGGPGGGKNRVSPPPETVAPVKFGLKWLADHQEADGHWDAKKWGGNGLYDTGVTGLALLAFAGAGHTERSGRYRRTVRKAINWLASRQDEHGNLAPGQTMYSHAISALALLEEAAMAPVPRTKAVAKRALDYMLSVQNEYKAWRYWPKDNENDVSVTTWCVMALKAAKIAKFDVPDSAWAGVTKFLDEVTEPTYGQVGYTSRPIKGSAEQAYQKYSMTACGILCRLYLGKSRKDRLIRSGVRILMENLPEWNQPGINAPFFYYWYYGSLAMFQVGGDEWKKWNTKMMPILTGHQNLDEGELCGSWDPPTSHHFGQMGGRVYSTAMAVLTLEVYYRYEMISSK